MEESAIERLLAKSPEEAIIEQNSRDFNLAPFMARTQFEQMRQYFEDYFGLERGVGQMTVLVVSASSPPGRPMAEYKRVPVSLTMDSADDLQALRHGVAALRRSKIRCLTRETQEQGALLTQEDLARLLCVSRSTIKRDIAHLRSEGVNVPTRGQVKDIERGVSHKTCIVSDWLAGYTFSEIKRRRWHALGSNERYCLGFQRVARLHAHGLSVAEIRISTGLSERLIQEYLPVFGEAGPDNERLKQLLHEPNALTKEPAEAKRGSLLR